MKFRCERDVLVDALGTAGRAATSRAALPVLSGLRLQLSGDQLRITGSDLLTLDLHATLAARLDAPPVAEDDEAAEDETEAVGALQIALTLDDGADAPAAPAAGVEAAENPPAAGGPAA